jgi:ketosteroid isomerase-like protein
VLALPTGDVARGEQAIRDAFQRMLAGRPVFTGGQRRPVVNGDLALTWTRLQDGATAEIARRQPDGTWLWAVDQPYLLA